MTTPKTTAAKKKSNAALELKISNLRAFLILLLAKPHYREIPQTLIESVGAISVDDPGHINDLELELYRLDDNDEVRTYEDAVKSLSKVDTELAPWLYLVSLNNKRLLARIEEACAGIAAGVLLPLPNNKVAIQACKNLADVAKTVLTSPFAEHVNHEAALHEKFETLRKLIIREVNGYPNLVAWITNGINPVAVPLSGPKLSTSNQTPTAPYDFGFNSVIQIRDHADHRIIVVDSPIELLKIAVPEVYVRWFADHGIKPQVVMLNTRHGEVPALVVDPINRAVLKTRVFNDSILLKEESVSGSISIGYSLNRNDALVALQGYKAV